MAFCVSQLLVARQIGPRLIEARLILEQCRLGLLQVDLVLARIDLREKLPLGHVLAFLIAHRGQVAAQLRQHRHRGGGRDRAELGQRLRHARRSPLWRR